jgi:hypothetical protein
VHKRPRNNRSAQRESTRPQNWYIVPHRRWRRHSQILLDCRRSNGGKERLHTHRDPSAEGLHPLCPPLPRLSPLPPTQAAQGGVCQRPKDPRNNRVAISPTAANTGRRERTGESSPNAQASKKPWTHMAQQVVASRHQVLEHVCPHGWVPLHPHPTVSTCRPGSRIQILNTVKRPCPSSLLPLKTTASAMGTQGYHAGVEFFVPRLLFEIAHVLKDAARELQFRPPAAVVPAPRCPSAAKQRRSHTLETSWKTTGRLLLGSFTAQ